MTQSTKTNQLLKHYFILWGLYITFFVLLSVAKIYYPTLFEQEYEQGFLQELLKEKPLQLFILAVLVAPIIEEMMFRTIVKPSHNDILLFLCSWSIFYLNTFIPTDVNWIIKIGFVSVLLFTLYYIAKQLIPIEKTIKIRSFLDNYYIVFLIVSSLLFGLIHINNYIDTFIVNVALISLIIPRILSGFMMGIIKIKNKHLIWSIFLHALNNGVAVGVMILGRNITSL